MHAAEKGVPVVIMEPLRGGRLAKLSDADDAKLKALRPDESIASWGFRWLQGLSSVRMILSGMSNLDQMKANIAVFETSEPLNETEDSVLQEIADGMKNALPCTGCRYCCDGCPMGLNIPLLINAYNDARFQAASVQRDPSADGRT